MPRASRTFRELPANPDPRAPPEAEPRARMQDLEDIGIMSGFGEVAERTRSRDRLRCPALHVRTRCRTGSRNLIKAAGAQAGVGGTKEVYGMVIKTQALTAATICRPRAGASGGGPSQPWSRRTLRIWAPCVLELRTWFRPPTGPWPAERWGHGQQSFGAQAVDPEGVGGNPSLTDH